MEKFVRSNSLRRVTESIINLVDNKLDGKSFKYLTFAEYEALSEEEKNRDDVVYQITDSKMSYNDLTDKPDLTVYATKDEVADLGFSGDYNDLENKPIYDTREGQKILEFTGIDDYTESVSQFIKISDEIFTRDDLSGAVCKLKSTAQNSMQTFANLRNRAETRSMEIVVTDDMIIDVTADIMEEGLFVSGKAVIVTDLLIIFVDEDVILSDGSILTTGAWAMCVNDGVYPISEFELICDPGIGELRQLEEKFIPDTIARTEDLFSGYFNSLYGRPCFDTRPGGVIKYSGNRADYEFTTIEGTDYIRISDHIISLPKISDINFSYNGKEQQFEVNSDDIEDISASLGLEPGKAYVFSEIPLFIFVEKKLSVPGINLTPGVWMVSDPEDNIPEITLTCNSGSDEGILRQLDEKFIPDTIARKSDVANIVIITQAEYEALEAAGQNDPDVYYLISDEI